MSCAVEQHLAGERGLGTSSCIRLRMRRKVDLPQPDGPISAVTWPAGIVSETRSSTLWSPNQAVMSSAWSSAARTPPSRPRSASAASTLSTAAPPSEAAAATSSRSCRPGPQRWSAREPLVSSVRCSIVVVWSGIGSDSCRGWGRSEQVGEEVGDAVGTGEADGGEHRHGDDPACQGGSTASRPRRAPMAATTSSSRSHERLKQPTLVAGQGSSEPWMIPACEGDGGRGKARTPGRRRCAAPPSGMERAAGRRRERSDPPDPSVSTGSSVVPVRAPRTA